MYLCKTNKSHKCNSNSKMNHKSLNEQVLRIDTTFNCDVFKNKMLSLLVHGRINTGRPRYTQKLVPRKKMAM